MHTYAHFLPIPRLSHYIGRSLLSIQYYTPHTEVARYVGEADWSLSSNAASVRGVGGKGGRGPEVAYGNCDDVAGCNESLEEFVGRTAN